MLNMSSFSNPNLQLLQTLTSVDTLDLLPSLAGKALLRGAKVTFGL